MTVRRLKRHTANLPPILKGSEIIAYFIELAQDICTEEGENLQCVVVRNKPHRGKVQFDIWVSEAEEDE